ncbi:3-deoxy-D-manno-octulosonate cytidylyltransferase [Candidatus Endolissoclinum faulkneri L5]|uniref:3-deoxy-D-manno-octulosonate cytidylyltransferase n=1 Tax=Candidatus Endolissoclinum faulkneri L5 TaxID=1401328 RepID=V9TRB6_9PROT|nr:3-deoxy-manno-octulosonate cytidylyltransferase [Candidatus Endolissoclinum faulkneri]AHC73444.1 3-deoxy-D-manno-octulosonate cytidylyltransferase [Candidatus Endolissoclinum faulkneri L5]
MNPILLIPARLNSSRLPQKVLADINGMPMILQVLRNAQEADIGPVVVAAGDQAIEDVIVQAGGRVVMTDPSLPSGTDRIHQALGKIDPDGIYDVIINIQGDMPIFESKIVHATIRALVRISNADWGTAASAITDPDHFDPTSGVNKVVTSWEANGLFGRALYFSKYPIPWGDSEVFHHIGLYSYRRASLERFVTLPQSPLELSERLEQLRAIEAGMRIEVARVETVPLSVDTQRELDQIRALGHVIKKSAIN